MEISEDKSYPRSNHGFTPLHFAALNGHLDVCKYITEITDDKSPRCNSGSTPLHQAALNGHLDVCKYLMEIIDDKNPRCNDGLTPIEFARLGNQFSLTFIWLYAYTKWRWLTTNIQDVIWNIL